jgi:glycosyltransferase involved in cell wall biosynthesis
VARRGRPARRALRTRGSIAVAQVSVIILTFNEEANLPACLASLRGLDCELFVVDSGSTDATLRLARGAGARVFSHPFDTYAAQRNWAQRNLPLGCDWVLHLDADERLTPELVDEINRVLGGRPSVAGFVLRKRTLFMGRWIKHGGHYPAYHLRLFRVDSGSCEERLYDQHFLVEGEVATLKGDYIDVLTADITTWTVRHARWAELEARENMIQGRGAGQVRAAFWGSPIERRRWLRQKLFYRLPLFVRPFAYWFYRYVLRLGFLDGPEGLIFHFLQGCWYRFLVDTKVFEAHNNARAVRGVSGQTRLLQD